MDRVTVITAAFNNLVSAFAIIIGGVWVFRKFILNREAHPKVEFDLDCKLVGNLDGHKIVQLTAVLKNLGSVRHLISRESFIYRIRYLRNIDEVINGYEINKDEENAKMVNQVNFSNEFSVNHEKYNNWAPKYSYTFIDPGVIQKYCVVVALPEDAVFMLLQSSFKYEEDISDQHSAQRVFNIEN